MIKKNVIFSRTQSFKYVGTDITWVGQGVEEHGHVKDEPENVVVRVDPRYFRPTEVELLLVSTSMVYGYRVLFAFSVIYIFIFWGGRVLA